MMTPTAGFLLLLSSRHHDTRPTRFRAGLVAAQGIRRLGAPRRPIGYTDAVAVSVPARTLSKHVLQ
jgi:hypothetical protein